MTVSAMTASSLMDEIRLLYLLYKPDMYDI